MEEGLIIIFSVHPTKRKRIQREREVDMGWREGGSTAEQSRTSNGNCRQEKEPVLGELELIGGNRRCYQHLLVPRSELGKKIKYPFQFM